MSGYTEDMLLRDFLALAQKGAEEADAARLSQEALNAAMASLVTGPQTGPAPVATTKSRQDGEAATRVVTGTETAAAVDSTAETVTRTSGILEQVQAQVSQGIAPSGLAGLFDISKQVSNVQSAIAGQGQSDGTGSSDGVLDTVRDVVTTVLKSGLGFSPLLGTLFGLFSSGNDEPAAEPLVKYALPTALHLQAATNSDGVAGLDYDQNGRPRTFRQVEGGSAGPGAGATVTVNVQAMDARSFLDRSTEIAAAVREAMLNLNSINDVVADL